jgi:uncharacterized membrane protein YbhN (UPF0104 family)
MEGERANSSDSPPENGDPGLRGAKNDREGRRSTPLNAAIRLLIGIALIALLLARADISALLEAFRAVHPTQLTAGVVAVFLGVVFGAFRWRPFLDELGFSLASSSAVRLTLIGAFFNVFLPTGFGGDAFKAFRLRGEPGTLPRALASVLLDRWAGIVGIATLGAIGSAVSLADGDLSKPVVAASILAVSILGASIAIRTFGPRLIARRPVVADGGIRSRISLLTRAILQTSTHPRATRHGLAFGLVSAGCIVAGHVAFAQSLDIQIPIAVLASIVVVVVLVAAIPITVNGLGLREAAYVWALASYGVNHDVALAFALMVLGALLATGFIGAIVYLFGTDVPTRNPSQPSSKR